MTRTSVPHTFIVLAVVAASASACAHEKPSSCPAPVGATATCMEACDHMISLGCLVAIGTTECQTLCQESTVNVPESARVLGCYSLATSCDDVDDCSETCGPDDQAVVFFPDAGIDAGEDAGVDAEVDLGDVDAGSM